MRAARLDAEFGADGGGDGVGVVAHAGLGFGLDHDAGEGLGAGVADDDAAGVGELRLRRRGWRRRRWGLRRAGFFSRTLTLTMTWGKTLRSASEFVEGAAGAVDDVEDDEGGEEAVAGGGEVRRRGCGRTVRRRAAAPAGEHLLEDVFVADGGAEHADAIAPERGLEAHVGHGGGDDGCVA